MIQWPQHRGSTSIRVPFFIFWVDVTCVTNGMAWLQQWNTQGKNHINPTILLHLPLDSYSFLIMFLLEIEMDHLLESYSNIAIGQIWLDQPDSADLYPNMEMLFSSEVTEVCHFGHF